VYQTNESVMIELFIVAAVLGVTGLLAALRWLGLRRPGRAKPGEDEVGENRPLSRREAIELVTRLLEDFRLQYQLRGHPNGSTGERPQQQQTGR
jgi:hypothetical protein